MKAGIDAFIERWSGADGTESANFHIFITELCALLDLPRPDPASKENEDNEYVFERRVQTQSPSGDVRNGFIDLYRRGSFVCEAKQSGIELDTGGWDRAMMRAHYQADNYVRALPIEETRPPFILVVDVGRNIDVYAEFSRTGGTYTAFPDPRSHRIRLQDLYDEDVRERLRGIWLNPLELDPSKHAARVTRDISDKLARLAKSLEARGHDPQMVGGFLMRSLFTMFAEDVGLLPNNAFQNLLEEMKDNLSNLPSMMEHLWESMNTGGFSPYLQQKVLHFNGGLFASVDALPLERDEHKLLLDAAKADWRYVEPAIFGTLLERALDPRERHKLGAHYTPRAYVERLVMPTIIDPLRYEWENAKAAALAFEDAGKRPKAIETLQNFQKQLTETRVLDPACGSGNFLYVAMEHMKRLEGEVLQLLDDLGESQTLLEMEGSTVDPHQFLGIEINPRAASVAEMVLWIGYLQWHFRTHGSIHPPEPVLRDFKNIEHRDALLNYDSKDVLVDDAGKPITRWDGITMKRSPITGEDIPDESAQVEQYVYVNPRKAVWPEAEYIIGNPPFIGASTMRRALGDGYVDAVRKTWDDVPTSADFVMYWWHHAAELVRAKKVRRFGFITTNSIKQTFNRRVLETHMGAKEPLTLLLAIPDHPWVDSVDGAAVRIAMTVGSVNQAEGVLWGIEREVTRGTEQDVGLSFQTRTGVLTPNLQVGADVGTSGSLVANSYLSSRGVMLFGAGFILSKEEAERHRGLLSSDSQLVRPYLNGRDLTQKSRNAWVIDLYGLSEADVLEKAPTLYQHVVDVVKPARDVNNDRSIRENWWLHGRPRSELRKYLEGLPRFIATVETVKHRFFTMLDAKILPDNMLVSIAIDKAHVLGILSSRLHIAWALAAGGTLEDRPRYNKTVCFETFPFPVLTPEQESEIGALAEQIDAHRKRQQAQHEKLTLTNMYNVLEKLRSGEELTPSERKTHEQGLVSILRELHDDLDRAVFAAYGWEHLGEVLVGRPGATTPLLDKPEEQAVAEEELLRRLVALNAERAEEEKKGLIRWLRPEYQNPGGPNTEATQEALLDDPTPITSPKAADKLDWPKTVPQQIAAVRSALSGTSMGLEELALQFKGRRSQKRLRDLETAVQSLEAMGLVERDERGAWG